MNSDGYMVIRDREDRSEAKDPSTDRDTDRLPEGKKLNKVLGSKPFPPPVPAPKEEGSPDR